MTPWQLFIVVLGMGLITFALRLSFFLLQERFNLPPFVPRLLRFAPAAVLLGLVTPAVVLRGGTLALNLGNERLLAALVAVVVARATRNVLGTILSGMAALWLLQWLGW